MNEDCRDTIEQLRAELETRETYWRDWNGRAANHAAKLEFENERLRKRVAELERLTASAAPSAPSAPKIPAVDGLDATAWTEYLAHRKGSRLKALTPKGAKLAAERLIKLAAESKCTQLAIVEQSQAQGWVGLFRLKTGDRNEGNQGNHQSRAARVNARLREIAERSLRNEAGDP